MNLFTASIKAVLEQERSRAYKAYCERFPDCPYIESPFEFDPKYTESPEYLDWQAASLAITQLSAPPCVFVEEVAA